VSAVYKLFCFVSRLHFQ